MSFGRARIHGNRPAQQGFSLLKVLCVRLESAEHVQRDELGRRDLQELAIGSSGLGEASLLVQLERMPEQWQNYALLPFVKPGILKRTLTDAVAHESFPQDLLARLVQRASEDETSAARHDSLGQATIC
nr:MULTISPECIES: hypothetical protein [Bradyrhizobium]